MGCGMLQGVAQGLLVASETFGPQDEVAAAATAAARATFDDQVPSERDRDFALT